MLALNLRLKSTRFLAVLCVIMTARGAIRPAGPRHRPPIAVLDFDSVLEPPCVRRHIAARARTWCAREWGGDAAAAGLAKEIAGGGVRGVGVETGGEGWEGMGKHH